MIASNASSPWGQMIIAPHLPSSSSVTTAANSARNRGSIETLFQDYQSTLGFTKSATLAPLRGASADALVSAFQRAEAMAGGVWQRNGFKKTAYTAATEALQNLCSDLQQIGAEADKEISSIIQSKRPLPQKIAEITAAIEKHSQYAAHKAASHGNTILNSIREVLTSQGDTRSPEEFAAANGINLAKPPTPSHADIKALTERMLNDSPKTSANNVGNSESGALSKAMGSHADVSTDRDVNTQPANALPRQESAIISKAPTPPEPASALGPQAIPTPDLAPAQSTPTPTVSTPAMVDSALPTSGVGAPSASAAAPSFSAPTTTLGPQQLADSFTRGMDMGAPMSQGTGALTQNAMDTAFRPSTGTPDFSMPTATPADFSASTTPSSGFAAAEATQHAGTGSTGYAPASTAVAPTMYAPMAPMATMAPAAPVMHAGPLPAYGADLRPAVAAPVVPSAPPAPATGAPASAPTSGAGASAFNQQAVVRQAPTAAPVATSVPLGMTETATAAATSGAVTGALSAEAAAKTRLRSLVEAVARQEPKLRWAIGQRDDGSTVLVTDLAAGWIPPHVEIPTGVDILAPAPRRHNLETLLADTTLIETWKPGQYLPDEHDVAPTAMSIRARDLPDVDDINWELTQATNWRDGLPRLAHTLAKAGVAGTGILDTEAELLHQHLSATAETVLKTYPEADANTIGSWQLLAAIDALIAQRPTTLNYHFAWFQALEGGGRP